MAAVFMKTDVLLSTSCLFLAVSLRMALLRVAGCVYTDTTEEKQHCVSWKKTSLGQQLEVGTFSSYSRKT